MGVFSCSLFIISSAGEAWGIFFFEKKERKEKLAIFEGRGLKKWVAFLQRKKGERMIRRNESLSMFSSLTSYCQVIKPSITVFLPFIIHGFSPSLLHNPWFFFSTIVTYPYILRMVKGIFKPICAYITIIYMRNFTVFRK